MFSLKSIKNKLILILLVCSFTPLLLLRFMAFPKAQKDLEEALIRNLEGVKQKQTEIVKMWFGERKHDAKVVSKNVSAVWERSVDGRSRDFSKLYEYIEMIKTEYGYKSVYIISRDGTVLVSTEREQVGSNIMSHDYCREALNGRIFISRIQRLLPGEGENKKGDGDEPMMFISAPLIGSDNLMFGAVILKVTTLPLSEIMKSAKLGKTGETFLINREGFMLTESRFVDAIKKAGLVYQRTALELRVVNPHTGKLTDGAQKCLNGKDGYDMEGYINYDGRKVLGAWCWIPEHNCGLLAQINIKEGYGAAYSLKRFVLSMLLVLAFPLLLAAFYFGKRISDPILNITEVTKKITSGDLGQRVKGSGKKDEISELSQSFNIMAESLEEKTVKLKNYTIDLENTVKERTLKLQETTNFLNSILAGSTEYSIIAQDLNGNILAFNAGASLIYGYGPEEVIGIANVRDLHTAEDVQLGKVEYILDVARRTGRYEGEVVRRRKNGEIFPVHVTFTLRRNENGYPIGFVVISKDITKEKLVALEKEIVNNVNKVIASGLEIKEVYKNIYLELKRMIDFTWFGVASLIDGTEITENFNIVEGELLSTDWFASCQSPFHATAQGIAMKKGVPVVVADTVGGEYQFDRELCEKGIHAYLCFPLKLKGITTGAITLGSKKKRCFYGGAFWIIESNYTTISYCHRKYKTFPVDKGIRKEISGSGGKRAGNDP